MLEDILNRYPNQQNFQVNIPLLFAIFDLNNNFSVEILFHVLTYYLHYPDRQATKLIKSYKG